MWCIRRLSIGGTAKTPQDFCPPAELLTALKGEKDELLPTPRPLHLEIAVEATRTSRVHPSAVPAVRRNQARGRSGGARRSGGEGKEGGSSRAALG